MKRPFPRFEVLGFVAALAAGAACNPNSSVQPGAPVLTAISIVVPGANGPALTTVTATTMSCPSGTASGGACFSATYPTCERVTDNILCACIAGMAPPPTTSTMDAGADGGTPDASMSDAAVPDGTWSCSFPPTASVLYVFDRIIDTTPFDSTTPVAMVANASFQPANSLSTMVADYAPGGSPNEIIFPLLGDFRSSGPSILATGSPTLPAAQPAGSTVAVTLDKNKVRAKDMSTPFTATGLLLDGAITFQTQAFAVVSTGQPGGPTDAGVTPNMTPATVTFNNTVTIDPASAQTLVGHITATAAPGGTLAVDLSTMDGLNVSIAPHNMANWPASSTVTITIDATTPDAVGDTLGAAGATTLTFTTSAM